MTEKPKKSFEELRRETEELLARYASRLESTAPASDPADNVEVETPPPSESTKSSDSKSDDDFANDTDAFSVSLSALRNTLSRSSNKTADASHDSAAVDTLSKTEKVDEPSEVSGKTDSPKTTTDDSTHNIGAKKVSVLEDVPLPASEPSTVPQSAQESKATRKSKRSQKRASSVPSLAGSSNTPASLSSALKDIRNSVSDVEFADEAVEPEATEEIPTAPIVDDMPKSTSENLPKYPAKPRTRTCNRCGNETKLRNEKCQVCGRVDASLGILDNVIAGDLDRVHQILSVKPHAISIRTSEHDWTLLHMAAAGGNPKMVELLVHRGSTVNAQCSSGKTALHYAASKGYPDIVEILLLHHADTTLLYRGKSPVDLAHAQGHDEIVELLKSAPSKSTDEAPKL